MVAGDDSLVAGPEPGVRVVGVLKGDPVAALEPAADVSDPADPGEEQAQLGLGRPGPQALAGPGVGDHGSGVWVPNILSPYATWAYSWIRPPSRSRRRTRTFCPYPLVPGRFPAA